MPTIIGAGAFHGPVREGKGWDRPAMVARHNCLDADWVSDPELGLNGVQIKGKKKFWV